MKITHQCHAWRQESPIRQMQHYFTPYLRVTVSLLYHRGLLLSWFRRGQTCQCRLLVSRLNSGLLTAAPLKSRQLAVPDSSTKPSVTQDCCMAADSAVFSGSGRRRPDTRFCRRHDGFLRNRSVRSCNRRHRSEMRRFR